MTINKGKYKRIHPPRLKFPTDLKFTTSGGEYLLCNRKKVQIVASKIVKPSDYPPTDLVFDGIGIYSFQLTDVDYVIFSFYNKTNSNTEAVILPKDELLKRLTDSHFSEDKIELKLFLCSKGLIEFHDAGAEYLWMGIWLDGKRSFTQFYNNWNVFKSAT
ncbi:hypothetical protein [Draconibacterium sediminis]|uniref:hypothetical protein n=1 Tax=Draconibacterium sediminis TaxID=1544798 RepID=UPI0026E99C86|nr:hypothetical protein [Draconibacterium sediminis]